MGVILANILGDVTSIAALVCAYRITFACTALKLAEMPCAERNATLACPLVWIRW